MRGPCELLQAINAITFRITTFVTLSSGIPYMEHIGVYETWLYPPLSSSRERINLTRKKEPLSTRVGTLFRKTHNWLVLWNMNLD